MTSSAHHVRSESVADRRKRGAALAAGGITMIILIGTGLIPFYWVVAMVGLTYLAAAAAGRSRGSLWAPGLMLVIGGLAIALWLRTGRPPGTLQFLGLTVTALGVGAVAASFLKRAGYDITAMSVSMTLVAFGGFILTAQRGIFTRNIYAYGGLFILGGLVAIAKTFRPSQRPETSVNRSPIDDQGAPWPDSRSGREQR
jgi:drug/metabolite transporter superfamily protein YnfA